MSAGQETPVSPGGMAERFRRRVLSVATFVEVGRRMEPGESYDRVYRRLLLTAMAATESTSGVIFHLVEPGRARLVEAFGGQEGPAGRPIVSFGPSLRSHLRGGACVQEISGKRQEQWRELLLPILPAFEPHMLVCLDTSRGPFGFLLLGERKGRELFGFEEQELLVTLAGLFTILSDKIDFSTAEEEESSLLDSAPGSPTRALEELRERHPALRRYVGHSPPIHQILSDLLQG